MPRVNWYLSPESKAIFEAYKAERGFKDQDAAASAMIMELDKWPWRKHKEIPL